MPFAVKACVTVEAPDHEAVAVPEAEKSASVGGKYSWPSQLTVEVPSLDQSDIVVAAPAQDAVAVPDTDRSVSTEMLPASQEAVPVPDDDRSASVAVETAYRTNSL